MNPSRILIIGYQRSGTTLLRRLINSHPSVYIMFHEKWMLFKDNADSEHFSVSQPMGEKIVYTRRNMKAVLEYIRTWRSLFREQTRILHIVRHPLDIALSNMKLKWMKSIDYALQDNYDAVKYMTSKKGLERVIKYEDLVLSPHRTLERVYNHCELSYSDKLVDVILENGFPGLEAHGQTPKLNLDRALAYRKDSSAGYRNLNSVGMKAGIEAIKILNAANDKGLVYSWPVSSKTEEALDLIPWDKDHSPLSGVGVP